MIYGNGAFLFVVPVVRTAIAFVAGCPDDFRAFTGAHPLCSIFEYASRPYHTGSRHFRVFHVGYSSSNLTVGCIGTRHPACVKASSDRPLAKELRPVIKQGWGTKESDNSEIWKKQ
jgi:hypothetical protein